jgi:hypothetical protein
MLRFYGIEQDGKMILGAVYNPFIGDSFLRNVAMVQR